jgi:predicted TIM-barrel fold metal-dependent hydrolase
MTAQRQLIDFHTHPYRPQELAPATWEFIRRISPEVAEHGDRLFDPHYAADVLRAQGVEHAVVLAEHCPATSGNVRTETVLEICAAEPDFFLPFASVDINTDRNPDALLREYIVRGVRGLKLYPSYQFYYPNDVRLYSLYESCEEAGIPVLLHIGSSVIPGTRIKFCDPIYLDDVAVDFPELTIVMAHGGRGFWYDVCAFLASHKPNVYIDVTGLVPGRLLEHFPQLERMADKVVFGTDWPAMPKSVKFNADVIAGLGLSPQAQRRIFHDNAARILRLPVQRSEEAGGERTEHVA